MRRAFCEGCWEKQRRIDQLLEENHRLKAQLRYRDRRATEGFFGSSTPLAQRPVKASSFPEHQGKRGGAPPGHPGQGRSAFDATTAARVVDVPVALRCPACGGTLGAKGSRPRSVLDIAPRAQRRCSTACTAGTAPAAAARCRPPCPPCSPRRSSAMN
jgi:hypothetical protein